MSTLKTNAAQIGQSLTATQNFTLYTPTVPDGTVRLGVGNAGSVTDAVTITSAGNVGIGTSSPAAQLDVRSNSAQASITVVGGTDRGNLVVSTGAADASGISAGTVTWNGGDSTTGSAEKRLAIIGANTEGATANARGGFIGFATKTNGTGGALSERMRIDSSGNLLVGTTSLLGSFGGRLTVLGVSGQYAINNRVATNGDLAINFQNAAGGQPGYIQTNINSVSYVSASDYRLKHDIQPMTGALSKVAQLKPVTYKWNADDSQSQGFIAHELQEVVPECVTGEKDAVNEDGSIKPQGIDTSFLVATLAAAIQEQQAIIESLKARLDAANL
jgi:hypothetical protein